MYSVLLTVHFLSLAIGMGMAFSLKPIAAIGKRQPDAEARLAFVGQFRSISMAANVALVLLLVSGIAMYALGWAGAQMPVWFWSKMAAVVVLIVAVGMIHGMQGKARRTRDVGYLDKADGFGAVSGLAGIVALIFAVLSFH